MSFFNLFKVAKKVFQETTPIKTSPRPEIAQTMQQLLEKHLPANAVDYCYRLWQEEPFSFKISRTRSTCFGNYTFRDNQHKITVNHDLNIYAFLVTYIHEIAHQRAWLSKTKRKIAPHGKEWKRSFQVLMAPILHAGVFPERILLPLSDYMKNPAASSVSYAPLAAALQSFDEVQHDGLLLSEVPDNQWFMFRTNVFQKIEKRRTRVLCMERKTKRKYTILASARVNLIEL